MDPLGGGGPVNPKRPGPIAWLDHGIYRVEKIIAWGSLLVMASGYFLTILYSNLIAGPGQNAIERFILKQMGVTIEVADPALLNAIHSIWAPLAAGFFVLLLSAIAAITRRDPDGNRVKATLPEILKVMAIGAAGVGVMSYGIMVLPVRVYCGLMVVMALLASAWSGQKNGKLKEVLLWGLPTAGFCLWFVIARVETGWDWTTSLTKVLMMWVGFVGASMATYEDRNIQVDFVRKNVPKRWLRGYEALAGVVTGGFTVVLAALAYYSTAFTAEHAAEMSNLRVHEMVMPLPILIGFTLVAFRYGLSTWRLATGTMEPGGLDTAPESPKRFLIVLGVLVAIAVAGLLGMGDGGYLLATIALLLAAGAPLFVVIGGVSVACFAIWPDPVEFMDSWITFNQNFQMMDQMVNLGKQEALVAIPFFMIAGAIMSRGAIANQLVEAAAAIFGALPGGLAISTVVACMFFAAISGSSPVTVITIGAIMYPKLREAGYREKFSVGLVTSAGSLGIIIPPSIPMIVFALIATLNGTPVEIKDIFVAGVVPGLIIGTALALLCIVEGRSMPREKFDLRRIGRALLDGFWALFLPAFILIGIYAGVFNPIQASAIAVVLALVIELGIHKQLTLKELPGVLADSASLMGSLLAIIAVALGLSEFMALRNVPEMMINWLAAYELTPVTFIIMVNIGLLLLGCVMDIVSAIILFVPLLLPLAIELGFDPLHLGLIFIVNLEIGYLTPPLGLNLFVASDMFKAPLSVVMRAVIPFIGALVASLAIITIVPTTSVGLVNHMYDEPIYLAFPSDKVLKPRSVSGMDSKPTGFVAATTAEEVEQTGSARQKAVSLQKMTNLSRVSTVEATGKLSDFDAYEVRAVRVMEGDKHLRTTVIMTTETENCGEDDATLDEEEWVLRLEFPSGAKPDVPFTLGQEGVTVELIRYDDDGAETQRTQPESGTIVLLESELADKPVDWNPDKEGQTLGLFGAFELKFSGDTLNGKFVPKPCKKGRPVLR